MTAPLLALSGMCLKLSRLAMGDRLIYMICILICRICKNPSYARGATGPIEPQLLGYKAHAFKETTGSPDTHAYVAAMEATEGMAIPWLCYSRDFLQLDESTTVSIIRWCGSQTHSATGVSPWSFSSTDSIANWFQCNIYTTQVWSCNKIYKTYPVVCIKAISGVQCWRSTCGACYTAPYTPEITMYKPLYYG